MRKLSLAASAFPRCSCAWPSTTCASASASALIGRLSEESADKGLPLRIHVERANPARALYERLGFRPVADRGVYLFLERRAPGTEDGPAEPTQAEG